MSEDTAEAVALRLVKLLKGKEKIFAAAESCTAGLVGHLAAGVPGASRVFWGSFVTYSIDAKVRMLGLREEEILRQGAVSRETAAAMARGALERSGVDAAVAVTGLAGPEGDGSPVPVGTVWIGTAERDGEIGTRVFHFSGSRNEVRQAAARAALEELLKIVGRD
jgi:PncC family amidohydrolase